MSRHEQKIKKGARRFLEDGEEVLAAFVARPIEPFLPATVACANAATAPAGARRTENGRADRLRSSVHVSPHSG